ncbi:MAG: Uridylate kinase [Parcubacteria group bacterium]|nr:Uridylate kinase [Parcubacteria group bacterium]
MRLTRAKKREYIVVSVGGSLIVPDGIDVSFLKSFRELLLQKVEQGFSFYIIAGGGRLSRNYQEAVMEIRDGKFSQEDSDWLGIHATRLNAHLLRTVFLDEAQARIVKNPTRGIKGTASIIVGAGWKPGNSTDYCAVLAAKKLGAKKLVNLSNIDYVYTADPRKDPTAQKIEKIGWSDFRELIPKEWDPGLSSPFDPVAAKEADHLHLEVAIINGKKLDEFANYIEGKPFVGSVIS